MKKIILAIVFCTLSVSVVFAGSFYIAEGTMLRSNIDATLINYRGSKARVTDSRGNSYKVQLYAWSGNCREARVYAPNGAVAQTSICVRQQGSQMQVQAQRQSMQYQTMNNKQTHLAQARSNVSQQSSGWFADKPGLQMGLRGNPDSPHQAVQTQYVPLNQIYAMSDEQFARFRERTDWATSSYIPQTIQNSGNAADVGVKWTNKSYGNNYSGNVQRSVNSGFSGLINDGFNSLSRNLFN